MSDSSASGRAQANQALYLARIVLAAWRHCLEQRDVPAQTLALAFQAGVQQHLVAAYGWFLLHASGQQAPPGGLPRGCEDLSPAAPGVVFPGEINECRQLEASGWLAGMLRPASNEPPRVRRQDNLAIDAGGFTGHAQWTHWADQLERLFDRMGESLGEY